MPVSESTIKEMKQRGYVLIQGAASVNDMVVIEINLPTPTTRVLTLTTPEATAIFNRECTSDWSVFRRGPTAIKTTCILE